MIPERAAHELVRHLFSEEDLCPVYFAEAPQGTKEPYLIVYPIVPGRVGEVKAFFPRVQISCYGEDQFKALALADSVIKRLDGYVGPMNGQVHTDSCHAERAQPIRNSDGTWMVPVEMRFSYLEVD